uniref:Epimerase family protein SDR39U1 n=1 Tax=Hirondellea gigas TaxID=1518452 RepID=A0A6A7FZU3_9CRUS
MLGKNCNIFIFFNQILQLRCLRSYVIPDQLFIRNYLAGVVLGRSGGMIQQLFLPFYFGVGGPVGSGKQSMPWIHLQDVVGLFEHALHNSSVTGVMNGVAPQIITNAQFAKAFAAALWRPAFMPLPTLILNLMFSEERAKIMTEGQKVRPDKAISTNYKFKYPDIESACAEFAHLFAKK